MVNDRTITANARLDARDELTAKLRLPRSLTDAELILHAYAAWGEECVKHLLGDFAFAIWDSRARRYFCARDHFGVKPFYFTHVANEFAFSSSLNELRLNPGVSNTLNEIAVGDYLLFGVNQDLSTTIFKDIQRLPPGHSLTVANGSITTRRYWKPAVSDEVRFRDPELYVDRFSELLSNAVSDRMDSDRVAILMSGGLDSTSVAAIAREHLRSGSSLHACSVVYDHLIPDEERYYSTAAANHLGIPISYVVADRYSLFDEQVSGDMNQPEPFLLSPLTAQFHNLLRLCATHSNIALTGWDGDSFMNEPQHSHVKIKTILKRMLRKRTREPLLPRWLDESFAKRTNLRDRYEEVFYPTRSREAGQSLDKTRPAALRALNSKVWTSLFEGYHPSATQLQLEVRHPLIDVRLVEFLLAIPPVPWCVNKHILRTAMKNRLPPAVLSRNKTPLAGDPALQLARDASVRWLDSFEVNPRLRNFVNLKLRQSIADEQTSDGLWASLRVFALNYWLSNSQPFQRSAENQVSKNRAYKTSIA